MWLPLHQLVLMREVIQSETRIFRLQVRFSCLDGQNYVSSNSTDDAITAMNRLVGFMGIQVEIFCSMQILFWDRPMKKIMIIKVPQLAMKML